MIRMIQSISASHAKSYFSDALLKADYYLDDQELQGKFEGKLSERIGLSGFATKDDFFALCENINPTTGERLTPRKKEERTIGYDINFHCPKSVSILNALSSDNHIIEAFQKSVKETMKHIEADSQTRVRKEDKYYDRKTGELIWAEFTHQTARPVDGSIPDPHLHSHCFTFNSTWDEKEQRIKACQFRDIKRDMPYYQARFHKHLSDNLIDMGYSIRRTGKSFEIEGVPKEAINLFSKRSDEIGQFAKEKGITNAKDLDDLGARTRSKKQKGYTMAELKAEWRNQLKETSNLKENGKEIAIRYAPDRSKTTTTPNACVTHSLDHSFERASVMPDRRVLETAYRYSLGSRNVSVDDITEAFNANTDIIQVKEKYRTYCTTKEVLSEEKQMVALAQKGKGAFNPLFDVAPSVKLDGQQGEAIKHILTTKDQVSIIRGVAGAGKTTLLKEAVALIEKSGKQVTMVAPTARASRGVLVDEGFEKADTVARLKLDDKQKENLEGQVLIVDEAGLLGTKDTLDLLRLADEKRTRVIFVGDTRQHASVVRGDALRILNTVGNIQVAEVDKIRRQKNVIYKEAVEHLSKGNIKEAFDKLDSIGSIKTVDPLKPNENLVEDYVSTVKKGKSAMIISPTHKQGESVTDEVRVKLRKAGLIGKDEMLAIKHSNLNFTEAQKTDGRNFENGQIIRFVQNAPNIKRGSAWTVIDASQKQVMIKAQDGSEISLPLNKPESFIVNNQSEIGLSKGDKVRITRNNFDNNDRRLNNGTQLEVLKVLKSGKTKLINPNSKAIFEVNKDFGDIDHAYCTTSHSSQGMTVKEVFISQPSSTFGATDAKQFYVSVSRGENNAHIYTDDKISLLEHASELGDRKSAMELLGKKDRQLDHIHKNERDKESPNIERDVKQDREFNNRFDKFNDYEPEF